MCTDMRLMRLGRRHVSARTYDWPSDGSEASDVRLRVVPRGQEWSAVPAGSGETLQWTNRLGFVGVVDGVSPTWAVCDGLNEAGLSVAHLELRETELPSEPAPAGPPAPPAVDLLSLSSWLLGTCTTVTDVRAALDQVQVWSPTVERLWPDQGSPPPTALGDYDFAEHLAIHDASGGDLVVEFRAGRPVLHDNPLGVLANSPPYEQQVEHMRATLATNAPDDDVTSRSRFIRAAAVAQIIPAADDLEATVEQAFRSLEPLTIAPNLAPTGDTTHWCVVRDHDTPAYHVRHLDTGAHVHIKLPALDLRDGQTERTLPLPVA